MPNSRFNPQSEPLGSAQRFVLNLVEAFPGVAVGKLSWLSRTLAPMSPSVFMDALDGLIRADRVKRSLDASGRACITLAGHTRSQEAQSATPVALPKPSSPTVEASPFTTAQQIVFDALKAHGLSYDLTIRQLANRLGMRSDAVWPVVRELESLGYVRQRVDSAHRLTVSLHLYWQPAKPLGEPDPVEVLRRVLSAILHYGRLTPSRITALCCEIPKDQRSRAIAELVQSGCLEACLDRGRPALGVVRRDQAIKAFDALVAFKRGPDAAEPRRAAYAG